MTQLLDPDQRQIVLRILKKGPQFGDRDVLGSFALNVASAVTGKSKATITKHYDQHMKEFRRKEANGPIPANHTFIY